MTDERCTVQELEAGDKSRLASDYVWREVTSINKDGTHIAVRWDSLPVELWSPTRLVYVQRQVKAQQPVCTDEAMRFWEKAYLAALVGFPASVGKETADQAIAHWRKAKQDISEGKL